ncbi:MAG: hypothetical protein WC069_05330 [Candidatus Shapirobacteria bacterium]
MLFVSSAYAQCPVCIVTVGGGMLIAKKLGIDDLLVSVWISALNTAIAFYLAPKIKYRLLNNPWILSFLLFATTLIYFQTSGQLMHSKNQLLGIDKIILGQTLGMFTMFIGNFIYGFTKYKNEGKALFPYSKVIFPVGLVLVISLVFKFVFAL